MGDDEGAATGGAGVAVAGVAGGAESAAAGAGSAAEQASGAGAGAAESGAAGTAEERGAGGGEGMPEGYRRRIASLTARAKKAETLIKDLLSGSYRPEARKGGEDEEALRREFEADPFLATRKEIQRLRDQDQRGASESWLQNQPEYNEDPEFDENIAEVERRFGLAALPPLQRASLAMLIYRRVQEQIKAGTGSAETREPLHKTTGAPSRLMKSALSGAGGGNAAGGGGKRTWKRSELAGMSLEEFKKNEKEINAAAMDGRIVEG